MGARIRRQVAESKTANRIRDFVVGKVAECVQKLNDAMLYFNGSNEQLMLQQGQMMTVQAGILEWLDQHLGKPGVNPSDQINAIVQQNIARVKAEREAREAEAKARAEEEAAKLPSPDVLDAINQLSDQVQRIGAPADIAPASPADEAPADPGASS